MRPRRSRLTDEQSMRLMEHFVAGTPARTAAQLVGVNRNTARVFYHRVRKLIAQHLAEEGPFKGPVGVEERYAQPEPRRAGKGGRQPVFALVKRGGKVYTALVLDVPGAPRPRARVRPDSIVYADRPVAGSSALDVSRLHHRRIGASPPAGGRRPPLDEIENFWNQAKRYMRRYNGIPRRHFDLF